MESELFRKEVLDSHFKQSFGQILLVHPISHSALALLGLAILVVILLFLTLGEYTRRATLPGVLEPAGGLAKVYASRAGRLKSRRIAEGDVVHKDDVLLIFTSEHNGTNGQAIEQQSEAYAMARLDTLDKEMKGVLNINRSDLESNEESLKSLRMTHANLSSQIANQYTRVQAARAAVKKYQALGASGYMSTLQIQDKMNDLNDQELRLQSMQKELVSNEADIARITRTIASAPERSAVAMAQIQRNIESIRAELDLQKNQHDWSVTAPSDGVVSGLAINVGQNVDTNAPLLTVVPQNDSLQAILYTTSRNSGFLKAGQHVKIKLDSFPYQKFGFVDGKVINFAASPVLSTEISPTTRLNVPGDRTEPIYAVKVQMEAQTIKTYGRTQQLRPGMQLTADVELDTRRIHEWILEPMFTLSN